MASFIGSDITEIVCKHSLGTFRFSPIADEDVTVDPGGIRNEVGISANGQTIQKKKRVPWSFEAPVAVDFSSENEIKNLPLLAQSSEEGIWTISYLGGAVQKAKGVPEGDLQWSTKDAQMTLKVMGGGILENI